MGSYAVVFNYNFDEDVAVYLFGDQESATRYLRAVILEEARIDTDENGWDCAYEISDSGLYGIVKTFFPDHTDIMEARIGNVYQ